jgi:hypothetical protein
MDRLESLAEPACVPRLVVPFAALLLTNAFLQRFGRRPSFRIRDIGEGLLAVLRFRVWGFREGILVALRTCEASPITRVTRGFLPGFRSFPCFRIRSIGGGLLAVSRFRVLGVPGGDSGWSWEPCLEDDSWRSELAARLFARQPGKEWRLCQNAKRCGGFRAWIAPFFERSTLRRRLEGITSVDECFWFAIASLLHWKLGFNVTFRDGPRLVSARRRVGPLS